MALEITALEEEAEALQEDAVEEALRGKAEVETRAATMKARPQTSSSQRDHEHSLIPALLQAEAKRMLAEASLMVEDAAQERVVAAAKVLGCPRLVAQLIIFSRR